MDHDPRLYACPGCGGTTDSRETMDRHEAGCVLALRQRVWELEDRDEIRGAWRVRDEAILEATSLREGLRESISLAEEARRVFAGYGLGKAVTARIDAWIEASRHALDAGTVEENDR